MQKKQYFSYTNMNSASSAMQLCILSLMNEPATDPDIYEMQLMQINKYCKDEDISFTMLERNLNEYFELLDSYRNTKTRIFLRFLKLQARNCLIDENNIELLQIIKDEVIDFEDYYTCNDDNYISSGSSRSSSFSTTMVGGHIIGL